MTERLTMLLRRTVLATAMLAVCGLTAGCFTGTAAESGTRLRVALPFSPTQSMSPWGDDSFLLTRLGIAETLVQLDAEGKPQPFLAASWTHPSPTIWSFRLRHGVRFHDGTALTAAHAAAALNRAAAASPVPDSLKGVGLTAEAVDEFELEVSTAASDPIVPQRLSSTNLVMLAPSAYRDGRVDPANAGTGPFVLPDRDVTGEIALAPFEEYWAGPSSLSGVDVRFVPDDTSRSAALRAGEVDVSITLPISELAGVAVREVQLPRTVSLLLNTSRPAFRQPAARLAAQEAVDPAAIARGVYKGRADVARGIFRSSPPWLITPSGATGRGRKVVLATHDDRTELPEVASAVAESLRGSGFEVEQVVRKYSLLEPDLLAGNFDAVIMSRPHVLDGGDLAAYLGSDFTCSGGFNLTKLCDPAIDTAVAAALAAQDVSSRKAAAVRAQDAVLATNTVIPLVHERAFIGHSPRVDGLATDPYERLLITSTTRLR